MISFANWVCVILIDLIKSRISPGGSYECNDAFVQWEQCIVFVILQQHTKYILLITKVREIIKRHFWLSLSLLYLFISNWKCFTVETRWRYSTWSERDELINHSKYIVWSGQKQPLVFYSKSCPWKLRSIHREISVLESLCNKELKATLLKRDSKQLCSCEYYGILRSPVLKNICEEMLLSDVISTRSI